MLHGDGSNRRRYLFAADAADAFDTILHKGIPGQVYNVDSVDEATNIEIAHRLLRQFGIPEEETACWMSYTVDRPFNDSRYAVNAEKLRGLGWRQKVRLDEGLPLTVEWYRRFGRDWWKGTEGLFESAFPEVGGEGVVGHGGSRTPLIEIQQEKLLASATGAAGATGGGVVPGAANGLLAIPSGAQLAASTAAAVNAGAGAGAGSSEDEVGLKKSTTKKRAREIDDEGKENLGLDAKRRLYQEEDDEKGGSLGDETLVH